MFRDLLTALADRYHVIAPDHLGFGRSASPPADAFDYTFDALSELTLALLDRLGCVASRSTCRTTGRRSGTGSRAATLSA